MADVACKFHPLGIELRGVCAEPGLVATVAAACSGWEGPPDPGGPVLTLELRRTNASGFPEPTEVRARGTRLTITGSGIEAEADSAAGTARCSAASSWFDDPSALIAQAIDPLLLFLLTRSGRTPIHAAGFLAGDIAVMLVGPSGAGKSCLALAAHAAGFRLLSDDTLYVQRAPKLRVWGVPRPIHLFAKDAPADAAGAMRLRAGKLKRAIAVDHAPGALVANRTMLCVLRHGARAALESIDSEAVRSLPLDPGFDLLRPDIEATMTALAARGAWRLTLSSDPRDAIALLADRLGRGP